ncbi:peptidoglycan-binding protein [Roseinatronobacter sp. S2]|uniref:peptidoglycan-binding domain-containing protein n=1 Tax=Roseinatronobacter sp. S2 TaxID=3035471 RepID=UPI0024102D26|nr:peptidoglycan-binding domain-containing protein [Roseinatronobacter sp. S2]WFE74046.1 peptidoglycan-binding domain-containing protein [Roseinatronobacter sp. S2]
MTHSHQRIRSTLLSPRAAVTWGVLVAAMLAITTPALANPVETSRARIEQSHLALPQTNSRLCWARYATRGSQNNDVIEEVAFRVPCPEHMTTDFIATLQRALNARGHYDGPITGRADGQTRAAVQKFQRAQGFDSPILTLDTAQHLGLLPIELGRN